MCFWSTLLFSTREFKCFCQCKVPLLRPCAIRKMVAVSLYDLVGMHLRTFPPPPPHCYFRLRYSERFFFLPVGFRSFQCVLVTVGINRVVDGRRQGDQRRAHSLTRASIDTGACNSQPMLAARPSAVVATTTVALPSNLWIGQEKNDAFGSELTGN